MQRYTSFYVNEIQEGPMLNVLFLSMGVMFMENHWKEYHSKISRAMLLRYLWLLCVLILSLAYQATLKVNQH